MADALEVHVTMPGADAAASLARALVDEELAACVTMVPGARSIYRFEGEVHEDEEVVCFVKTHPALFERLRDRILALHPYDIPEILAFKVHDGSKAYLDWLHGSVAVTER
ncbi:MAG TPA: divalent-cation tolerance protein CutA [Polyangia bacterium]|nr:divalent-cation tolerance protein CutA [Polyangia bacterium]